MRKRLPSTPCCGPLDARGRDQAPGLDGALWRTLRGRLFTEDAVRKLAIQIKGYRRLFRSWSVARVVIGDATNTECRMAAEVASALNIPVDELPNGIFLCRMHNNARKAEYGERPAVRRGLAWSRRFASIMRQDFDDQPITMTGYPPVSGAARDDHAEAGSRPLAGSCRSLSTATTCWACIPTA